MPRAPLFVMIIATASLSGCNAITGADDLELRAKPGTGGAGGATSATSGTTQQGATTSDGASTTTGPGATTGPGSTSTSASTSGASTAAASTSASTGGGTDPYQLCVDTINMYRGTLGLPPYTRWSANEMCVDGQAQADAQSGTPHSAFGQCSENAQNECPGWPGPPEGMIANCLQMMWNEGPGADFSTHGHYINMSSTQYTMVACGYYSLSDGSVWATQDFK